jgi:hypothetical protein
MVFYFIFTFYILGNFATDDNGFFKCNCMPACTELSYDVETSQAEYTLLDSLKAAGIKSTAFEK